MGRAEAIYAELMWQGGRSHLAAFDIHVAACILALSIAEAEQDGLSLAEATGLNGEEQRELLALAFPEVTLPQGGALIVSPEERGLREMLWLSCAEASDFEALLARLVARRCQRPNHLWQDLGLASRIELSMLMHAHFPRLAARNRNDMKWKKFFYRQMCGSDGIRICAAPVCSECDEFESCFGSEDGEALLARLANGRSAGEARQ